jgi:hypothetical protein
MGPKTTKQTKSRKEQIITMRKENDQSRKIFSLWQYHPKCTQSCLVSEAKQGQAWLVLGWDTDVQKRLLRDKQFGDKRGNAVKVQTESLMTDLSKITKAERIEEVVTCMVIGH